MLPAVGQGALALETRGDDRATRQRVAGLDHPPTHVAVLAERAMLAALQGGCLAPIAALGCVEETDSRSPAGSSATTASNCSKPRRRSLPSPCGREAALTPLALRDGGVGPGRVAPQLGRKWPGSCSPEARAASRRHLAPIRSVAEGRLRVSRAIASPTRIRVRLTVGLATSSHRPSTLSQQKRRGDRSACPGCVSRRIVGRYCDSSPTYGFGRTICSAGSRYGKPAL